MTKCTHSGTSVGDYDGTYFCRDCGMQAMVDYKGVWIEVYAPRLITTLQGSKGIAKRP